jgi:hypothetical protein
MKLFLFFCLFALTAAPLWAQYDAVVELNKSSALSIFVETNMMNFSLVQHGENLLKTPVTVSANVQKNKVYVDHNRLEIDVRNFKSDNRIGQSEFYKLMKVDQFPKMNIELVRYEAAPDKRNMGTAVLNITVTNVTRSYAFPVTVGTGDGSMRIAGRKRISITDFGLNAPTNLLFGLAKINEQIVIDLNLLANFRMRNGDVANR